VCTLECADMDWFIQLFEVWNVQRIMDLARTKKQ
jgi:hypothetical protein